MFAELVESVLEPNALPDRELITLRHTTNYIMALSKNACYPSRQSVVEVLMPRAWGRPTMIARKHVKKARSELANYSLLPHHQQ
jgi:hypothetical protein